MPSTPPVILHLPDKPGPLDREILIVNNGIEHSLHRNSSTGALAVKGGMPVRKRLSVGPSVNIYRY